LEHPYVQPEVDSEGLAEIFALGPARSPGHGVYRGMAEVKPGHYMIYNHHGLHMQRYWTLESRPHTDSLEATAERVCDLLGDTVKRQLVSDVPVCVLLSGGLDSSALTAFASAAFEDAGSGPLHTYSVDYLDNESHFQASHYQPDSDKPWVEYVSSHFGTCHHRILIGQEELAESLERAVLARDLPGMADVDSSLYLFCREIKKDATVALSGEAADEIFGGYPWFHSEKALNGGTFPG
jgi:asparagine synthase (glutamine-hydrolysing)